MPPARRSASEPGSRGSSRSTATHERARRRRRTAIGLLGFVGRPAGGGVAGGFGVYQQPIALLAREQGRPLTDLSDRPASTIYRRLRSGRAVMAWVGLSYGPYETWRSPTGRAVKVNFGEHAVVVSGFRRDGALEVITRSAARSSSGRRRSSSCGGAGSGGARCRRDHLRRALARAPRSRSAATRRGRARRHNRGGQREGASGTAGDRRRRCGPATERFVHPTFRRK